MQERTGISFGGSWGVFWRNYSDPASGEHDAVGQKFALNVSRDMFHRGTHEALAFDLDLGWVRPNSEQVPEPFQRDQVTAETFYRFHITPNLATGASVGFQIYAETLASCKLPAVRPFRKRLYFQIPRAVDQNSSSQQVRRRIPRRELISV